MFKNRILCFAFFLSFFISFGQEFSDKIGSIQNLELESEYLKEKRTLEIYLPPSYNDDKRKKYPVMYVMDGQEYFLHPVTYQRMLRFKDKTPEFIVIGINSDRQKRRVLYDKEALQFINFLKNELVPFVDDSYRTLKEKERIYFGWEMAGGMGLEIFSKHPGIFNAFFMASPTHFTEERLMTFNESLGSMNDRKSYLYFSKAPEETYIEKSIQKADSILKSKHSKKITWKVDNLLNEDHYTTSLKTINNGLRNHFGDYNTLRFYSLKEFDAFGNLEDIKNYYRDRGNRYQIATDVHRTTKHFLLLNAMNENKLERFVIYAQEFREFLLAPSREIWPVRFGGYLAENGKYTEALAIYESGLKKFPESASIHNAVGTLYKNKENKEMARSYYEKAIEFAEKNKDSNIEKYKISLKEL
ncbi:alpha/beta hydrolase-fold protein [Aquimarina sp. D1M17]|uniref:alpha/beta hydrolase-fold protein n=1 Tax=Aquimarina acroporae TaxID=2937283 RepID=UPI0020BFD0CA|nr:alpha/beta hydrolase-fold protein [Aquimarina acroporae]MCK8522983.1 alpha/beta hydrolase-fold protein [Aquimarina acroporae]